MRYAILMTQSWGMPPTEEFWLGSVGVWVERFADAKKFTTKDDAEAALIGIQLAQGNRSTSSMTETVMIIEIP